MAHPADQTVDALRDRLGTQLQPLRTMAASGGGGIALARQIAVVYDGVLVPLFRASLERPSTRADGPRVALLAVGGYGRKTLGSGSDLDLVILTEHGHDPFALQVAEALLYPLWDAGVTVGH